MGSFDRELLGINVLEAAKERIRAILKRYDETWVAFSGGKDSLVVLSLTEQVYAEDKIPGKVNVMFRDEELIPDSVVDFVQSYANTGRFNFMYLAVPLKSSKFILGKTFEYTQWDDKRKWIRAKPKNAIVTLPGADTNKQYSQYDLEEALFGKQKKSFCVMTGLRADESMVRQRAIVNKKRETWVCSTSTKNVDMGRPIYDWKQNDVFKFFYENKIKYCPIYDEQVWNGDNLRVSTPLHAEAAKRFYKLKTLYPIFYQQIVAVFPEMLVQDRYYKQMRREEGGLPPGYEMTWSEISRYIQENIKDVPTRKTAIQRVYECRRNVENQIKDGRGSELNNYGYPIEYVFRHIAQGLIKRSILPMPISSMKGAK